MLKWTFKGCVCLYQQTVTYIFVIWVYILQPILKIKRTKKTLQYFVETCGFAICGLIIKNCGFAICRLAYLRNLRICDLRTRIPKKFAGLRWRNEPKNLRIFDLRFACLSLLLYRRCADVSFPTLHRKTRLATFPSPAGMSLTKLSLGGKNLIITAQEEFGKWHPGWEREFR